MNTLTPAEYDKLSEIERQYWQEDVCYSDANFGLAVTFVPVTINLKDAERVVKGLINNNPDHYNYSEDWNDALTTALNQMRQINDKKS